MEEIDQSKRLINRMLSIKNFNYNSGIDYHEYVSAVWRTLLKDNSTSDLANKVKNLVDEEQILELISKRLQSKKITDY